MQSKTAITYGFHAVESQLIHSPKDILAVYIDTDRNDARVDKIITLCKNISIEVKRVPSEELSSLTTHNHQGIVALSNATKLQEPLSLEEIVTRDSLLILVLDHIQDPHNLGACIRTAAAAGVDAIIIPKAGAAQINATVKKVSSGTTELVPIITVSNINYTIDMLKENRVWCYGLAGDTTETIYSTDLTGKTALIMGAEGPGLKKLVQEKCDGLVSIPLNPQVESLNVSVATGIALFEALRQKSQ